MANILPSSVLFCCTMNEIRSPMAEGIMKHLHGRRVFVDSAGVHQGKLDPMMVAVMSEINIDMGKHNPKTFDNLTDDSFDMAISLSPPAQHKAVDLSRYHHCDVKYWKVSDPSLVEGSRDVKLAAYRQVRDELRMRILELFPFANDPRF
ncbi:MAG: arsenate reductase ArsC [Rhodospirillaceae bacterium]|nr:arsenate reductase ArsC [Rhodospirillaceae bacterium]